MPLPGMPEPLPPEPGRPGKPPAQPPELLGVPGWFGVGCAGVVF